MGSMKKRLDILSIDKYALDEEWSEQPKKRYIYHEKISSATEIRDIVRVDQEEAKGEYRRIHSKLIFEIKQNPQAFDLDGKPTDAICDAIARNHPERREAFGHYIECGRRLAKLNKQVNRLEGMLDSFIDRRKGLDALLSLYFNNYFSQNPKIQQMADDILSSNEQFSRRIEEVDPELAEKLRNKRKKA